MIPEQEKPLNNTICLFSQLFSLRVLKLLGFSGGSDGTKSACSAGDPGLISGSGRCPGEGNGNPLHYACLEKSMDQIAFQATVHGVANNQT